MTGPEKPQEIRSAGDAEAEQPEAGERKKRVWEAQGNS